MLDPFQQGLLDLSVHEANALVYSQGLFILLLVTNQRHREIVGTVFLVLPRALSLVADTCWQFAVRTAAECHNLTLVRSADQCTALGLLEHMYEGKIFGPYSRGHMFAEGTDELFGLDIDIVETDITHIVPTLGTASGQAVDGVVCL